VFFFLVGMGWLVHRKAQMFSDERDGYECIEYDKVLHFELDTSVAHLFGSSWVCRACECI